MVGGDAISSSLPTPATAHCRRPTCLTCNRPCRVCLCCRLRPPLPLSNPVGVTILQHRHEAKHPLNSARLAALALRNLSIFPVSDVHNTARFLLRLLSPPPDPEPVIEISVNRAGHTDLSSILASTFALSAAADGFLVKKKTQSPNFAGESDEFEIAIPAGSVVLFPCRRAVDLTDAISGVKHLVVLDGTWAKARRMYHENPWLQLLPAVKLAAKKDSIYGEVRQQPGEGCLSTVESIVFSLQQIAGAGDLGGLEEILAVFESMVADQRRCKDEKFASFKF